MNTHVRPTMVLAAAVVAAAAYAQAPAPSQVQPSPPRFRAGVTYVEVDASVTDDRGRFVPGLRAGDLQLFEDGQRRTISTFSLVDLPVRAAGSAPADAAASGDSRSNEDVVPGRVSVVVLDDLHTAPQNSNRVRAIVRRYIENYVGPSDLVAMLSTGAGGRIVVDFTSSHETLLGAVNRFLGRRPSWIPPGGAGSRSQLGCFT